MELDSSKSFGAFKTVSLTDRPLQRYWNSLVRSVRVPVPRISWNMTNPLMNIFGTASTVLETPVNTYDDFEDESLYTKQTNKKTKKTNKRKTQRTRKKNSNKKSRRRPAYENDVENEAITSIYEAPVVYPPKYMYFYDKKTNRYFEVKAQGIHGHDYYYGNRLYADPNYNQYYYDANYQTEQNLNDAAGGRKDEDVQLNNVSNDDESQQEEQSNSNELTDVNKDVNEALLNPLHAESIINDKLSENVWGKSNRQKLAEKKMPKFEAKSKGRQRVRYFFLRGW